MIINPLNTKREDKMETDKISLNNNNIVNDIIEYIINNHSSTLAENLSKENRKIVENLVKERLINKYINLDIDVEKVVKLVLDRFFGYYILQKYIDDVFITDIRVINYKNIFVKQKGVWIKTEERFQDEKEYLNFVRNCILKNGGKINNEKPIVVVSDKEKNLRIEAGIDPVNVLSPNLVIRIHRVNNNENLESLLFNDSYMFNFQIYSFLFYAINSGCNIIISGKGASGKTTLLRSLINKLPDNISITSNEETAEIFSNHPNIIQREILQNRINDKNITLEQLTKECLVMSNDVIVVGEIKGAEALSFLDAISTGHVGYATIHSNNAENTINRLCLLMKKDKQASMYTTEYLEKIIGNTLDIIIHMNNFKIVDIIEVYYDDKKEKICFNQLYTFQKEEYYNGCLYGSFQKVNNPKYRVKEKIKLNKNEIERILNIC